MNLAAASDAPALAYETRSADVFTPAGVIIRSVKVQWLGATTYTTSDLFDEPPSEEDRSALEDAGEWLKAYLCDGPKKADDVKKAGKKDGHSEKTLRRAKGRLGIKSTPIKDEHFKLLGWEWALPEAGARR